MANLLAAQSGGPTAAINASLAGVVKKAVFDEKIDKVYGLINGIEGIFSENFVELNNIDIQLLKKTPAAYLGSCRYKLPDFKDKPEIYDRIFSFFKKHDIKYFLYIGGNDSMDTVAKLSVYARENKIGVNFIGIPKTIDNDLFITDHTPGFGSAAKYVAATVSEIASDSQVYYSKSVTIVEIMGRNAGWLTAAAALARNEFQKAPHLIYLPESVFSMDKLINDINSLFENGIKNIIIAISEGIRFENGILVCEDENCTADVFGHKNLSGAGKVLENYIKEKIGCKVRSVELNVSQRCAGHFLSKTDIDETFNIGKQGVKYAVLGKSGEMMIFVRENNSPYKIKISSADLTKIANVEKTVPVEYIKNKNDITDELIGYLKPLIQGEVRHTYKDGLPVYLYR